MSDVQGDEEEEEEEEEQINVETDPPTEPEIKKGQ